MRQHMKCGVRGEEATQDNGLDGDGRTGQLQSLPVNHLKELFRGRKWDQETWLPITEVQGLRNQDGLIEKIKSPPSFSIKLFHINTFRTQPEQSHALSHLLQKILGIE